jgi:hypothetical protein
MENPALSESDFNVYILLRERVVLAQIGTREVSAALTQRQSVVAEFSENSARCAQQAQLEQREWNAA